MGGGGMRSEETGQLAGWMRGTKGNGHIERCRQMGGVLGTCWGTEELGWNEQSRKKLQDVR